MAAAACAGDGTATGAAWEGRDNVWRSAAWGGKALAAVRRGGGKYRAQHGKGETASGAAQREVSKDKAHPVSRDGNGVRCVVFAMQLSCIYGISR